jgi:oxygen-dependent protoporphyrinogen oxidase
MSLTHKKMAVIGAGISGLALAFRLQQWTKDKPQSIEVHVFEKSSRTGGTIQTENREGFMLEKGPDGFIQQKTTVLDLAKELGIENELIGTQSQNRRSLILQNNRLIEVPDGFYLMSPSKIIPFLRSPLLSWKGKLRTLLEPFIPSKTNDAEESLANFVRRRFGQENLEKISQAMLGGIYTADPEKLSMQAALPRFIEIEKKYGSILRGVIATMSKSKDVRGPRYSLFGSFYNGMSRLTNALTAKIPVENLHLNSEIQGIEYNTLGKCWKVRTPNQEMEFDQVCFAIAPYQLSKLLQGLTDHQKEALDSIPYASSAIFHFGFKAEQVQNKPKAIGFIVPQRENKHFIACSLMSNKYENRAPQDHLLIRVFAGGALQEEQLNIPTHELRNKILSELKTILNIQGEPVLEDHVTWPKSMPQYTMGHMDRVTQINDLISKFPNLHIIGNGYGGVGIPDLIEKANHLAKKISN